MDYDIVFTKIAKKDIQKLDSAVQKRLKGKLLKIAKQDDLESTGKALRGNLSGVHRIRVGDYRLLYTEEKTDVLMILKVQHRKDVYK